MNPCKPFAAKSLAAAALVSMGVTLLSSSFNPAKAFVITGNDTNVVNFSQTFTNGSNSVTGVARATFTASNYSASTGTVDISLLIENLTTLNPPSITEAGLATLAFSADPNVTLSNFSNVAGGATFTVVQPGNGVFNGFEICLYAGNTCSGGPQPSLLAAGGAQDTVMFRLTSATGNFSNGLSLTPFEVKFQSTIGSFEATGTNGNGTPVPIPPQILATAVGAGLGALKLRRKRDPATGIAAL